MTKPLATATKGRKPAKAKTAAPPKLSIVSAAPKRHEDKTLIERLFDAHTAKAAADAEYEMLASQVREEYEASSDAYRVGDIVLKVTPNRLFNKAKALHLYGQAVCSPQVDLAVAKKVLTGSQLEDLYELSPGKPTRIVVELAKSE